MAPRAVERGHVPSHTAAPRFLAEPRQDLGVEPDFWFHASRLRI